MIVDGNLKLTPGVGRDKEGNIIGGFFVEDENGNVTRYEYKFIAMVGTNDAFVKQMEEYYRESGFKYFNKLDD